jgi:hypothetical protein
MNTSYEITADSNWSARQIAMNRAKAEGLAVIGVMQVVQIGPRQYRADLIVTKINSQ